MAQKDQMRPLIQSLSGFVVGFVPGRHLRIDLDGLPIRGGHLLGKRSGVIGAPAAIAFAGVGRVADARMARRVDHRRRVDPPH